MQDKLIKSDINQLLKDVVFITIFAVLFFFIVGKFGGYLSDYITKKSCTAIDEQYIVGKTPGSGTCIKNSGNINIKK
ncbi:MAG: hypothetical protein IIZ40_03575 [Bacilli bacterium]|nr:hypothetical protein [Bacilli bacterium]